MEWHRERSVTSPYKEYIYGNVRAFPNMDGIITLSLVRAGATGAVLSIQR